MKRYYFKFYIEDEYVAKKHFDARTEEGAMLLADKDLRKHHDKYDDWEFLTNDTVDLFVFEPLPNIIRNKIN